MIAVSISFKLTLFSLVVLPFSLIIISYLGLVLRKQSGMLQAKMADITSNLHETITGVKIVKAFGMEEYENKKFFSETQGFFKLVLRIARIRNVSSPVTEFLSVMVGVLIIYFGAQLVLVDRIIKPSEFITFLFAIFQLMPPVKELSSVNNRIQESSAAADRIFEILDTEPGIKNAEYPKSVNAFKDDIVFQNVIFKYEDSDEPVLDNINLQVERGSILAIVGSSGAGKTTFVDLIPRFYDPTSGKILLDGIDIKEIKIEDLRKLMGIVTQETVLFNESVKSNIAYGLDNFPDEKIYEAAKAANAHEFILDLPKGYDTIIGEKGTKLSGGQRQRISIARALLKNPPVMIFDEATSSLDNEAEVLVQEAIERLMHDRTTFVIAHRLSTIRNADRIIVLDRGKIVQAGKHEQLLSDENGIYRKLYELQFRD
jgi:subfamily B ATP-binding cassette protein MsbA